MRKVFTSIVLLALCLFIRGDASPVEGQQQVNIPTMAKNMPWECQMGVGDGLNAIPSGTYKATCKNSTGRTVTITAITCFSDNSGTSTCNATNGAGTGLLTGAVTATTSFAAGTQSATKTIANGDVIKISLASDAASKQIGIDVVGTF